MLTESLKRNVHELILFSTRSVSRCSCRGQICIFGVLMLVNSSPEVIINPFFQLSETRLIAFEAKKMFREFKVEDFLLC